MYTGPNIIEDGLVFGYDADDRTSRFYPGEPAVNCSQPLIGNNWATNMTKSEVTDGTIKPPRVNARVFKVTAAAVDNNWMRFGGYYMGGGFAGGNAAPLLLGRTSPSNYTTVGTGKYRFGFWVRGHANNSASNLYIDIGDRNGASITVDNNTNWQFISTTDVGGINNTSYPYDFFDIFFTGAVGNIFYISDLMIVRSPGTVDSLPTLQAYPQWVDYGQERTYTNSLIDLKRTNTIDLTNVSFDSTAHPVFDGTNDYIDLGNYLNLLGSVATFECIFKASLISDVYKVILGWGYGTTMYGGISIGDYTGTYSDESLAFTINGNLGDKLILQVREGSTKYTDNKYHHVVVTSRQNSYKIYIDGVEKTLTFQYGSQSSTYTQIIGYDNNVNTYIGKRPYPGSEGYFNGYIPVVKIYNKALTLSEIQQNFNSYKSKFSI